MRAPRDHLDAAARAVAVHGVASYAGLRRAGLGQHSIECRVASGLLRPDGHGRYVVADAADEWTPLVLHQATSEWLALSFEAAAAVYGWDGFDRIGRRQLSHRAVVSPWTSRADLRPFRRRDLRRSDLRVVAGVRVTSPAWTLAHLEEAASVHCDLLEQAVESALREGHVDEEALWSAPGRMLATVLGRRGRGTPPTGSRLETLTVQRVLRRHAIPVLQRQVLVHDGAHWQARPDFLLPAWTVLEVDGSQHEDGLAPAFDKDRDLRLATLDLHVLRAGWAEVRQRPDRLAGRIRRVVDQRRRTHPSDPPLVGGVLRLGQAAAGVL